MASNQDELLSLRHTALGWWCLFGFGLLGLVLESLNGFKVGWYMDLANSTRRHMWTLGHAHGTLLGLVNLAWARGLGGLPRLGVRQRALASVFLGVATTLVPLGFLAGGLFAYRGDPGLGIVLVPIGALAFVIAALFSALGARR